MAHSRRRRTQTGVDADPYQISRIWSMIASPVTLGVALLSAGALLMLAPWLELPKRMLPGWWSLPFQSPDLMQGAIMLAVGAALLALGLLAERLFSTRLTHERVRLAGFALATLGALATFMTWLWVQSAATPPTEATLPVGQQVEHVIGRVRGRAVKVMLPRRVKVDRLKTQHPLEVELTLSRPKQTDARPELLLIGESVEVDDVRLTFVGVGVDVTQPRAVIAGKDDQSIEVAARRGEQVRVTLNGPSYTVREITSNHLGALGPAVQLESEQGGGMFWLLQREGDTPLLDHDLSLRRLESAPAAVLTVAPALPFEPLALSAILCVVGLGLAAFAAPSTPDRQAPTPQPLASAARKTRDDETEGDKEEGDEEEEKGDKEEKGEGDETKTEQEGA